MLEHHTHVPADAVDVAPRVGDLHIVIGDLSPGGHFQQVQAPQKGGLSGAGGANDHHLLPRVDVLGDVIQDQVVPKRLGEMFNVDHFAAASFPICPEAS